MNEEGLHTSVWWRKPSLELSFLKGRTGLPCHEKIITRSSLLNVWTLGFHRLGFPEVEGSRIGWGSLIHIGVDCGVLWLIPSTLRASRGELPPHPGSWKDRDRLSVSGPQDLAQETWRAPVQVNWGPETSLFLLDCASLCLPADYRREGNFPGKLRGFLCCHPWWWGFSHTAVHWGVGSDGPYAVSWVLCTRGFNLWFNWFEEVRVIKLCHYSTENGERQSAILTEPLRPRGCTSSQYLPLRQQERLGLWELSE